MPPRTAKAVAENPTEHAAGNTGTVKRLRGKRGSLQKLPEMPLDILLEVSVNTLTTLNEV